MNKEDEQKNRQKCENIYEGTLSIISYWGDEIKSVM
jgi:hypothetical protein